MKLLLSLLLWHVFIFPISKSRLFQSISSLTFCPMAFTFNWDLQRSNYCKSNTDLCLDLSFPPSSPLPPLCLLLVFSSCTKLFSCSFSGWAGGTWWRLFSISVSAFQRLTLWKHRNPQQWGWCCCCVFSLIVSEPWEKIRIDCFYPFFCCSQAQARRLQQIHVCKQVANVCFHVSEQLDLAKHAEDSPLWWRLLWKCWVTLKIQKS